MRRFSQRNSLVTLNEINITPLLDLAFVLLIIFVITTPLLEQGMTLNLPTTGLTQRKPEKNDLKTVEVNPQGLYMFGGQRMSLDQVERELVASFKANPNIIVVIRADENGAYKYVASIIERCEKNRLNKVHLATQNK